MLVLVFEGMLIAVAPRFHSGSVLRIAKDSLFLRVGKNSSYYMAQGDLAWQQHPNALYETVFFQRGVRFIYPPTSLLLYRAWQPRRPDRHSSVGRHERDAAAGAPRSRWLSRVSFFCDCFRSRPFSSRRLRIAGKFACWSPR